MLIYSHVAKSCKKLFLLKFQAPVSKFAKNRTHLQVLVWEGMSWDDSTVTLSLDNNLTASE